MKSKPRFWTRAQGLVEFALILPVLLLLILGIIEMGRLLAIYSGISSGARQAVRYGSVAGDSDPAASGIQEYYLDCAGIRDVARRASPLVALADSEIVIGYDTGTLPTYDTCEQDVEPSSTSPSRTKVVSGDRIVVAITTVYRPIVPIVPIPALPLTFQAARTIFLTIIGPTPTPVCPVAPFTGDNANSTIGSSTITQTAGLTATVTVTIRNTKGCPQDDIWVSLAGGGPGTPTIIPSVATQTNPSGMVSFVVSATIAGTYYFTGTAATGVSKSLSMAYVAGEVDAATSTLVASPTTIARDGLTTANVTATLKDQYGNPVGSGKSVSLVSIGSGTDCNWPSTQCKVLMSPGVTNASGQVVFKAGQAQTGAYSEFQATDETDSIVINQTVIVNYAPGAISSLNSTVVAQTNTLTANNISTTVITVTIKDGNGAGSPLAGVTVALSSSRGGLDTITTLSGVTDSNGYAFFRVKSGTVGTSTYTATATDAFGSIDLADTEDVTYIPGAVSAATSTVVASPTSVQADGTSLSTITVTLKDSNSQPVSGKVVTIASSRPLSDTITTLSGVTNASGQATFTTRSTFIGTSVYTATDTTDSIIVTQTASVTFISAGADATTSTLVASPTTVQADGSSTSILVVTLKNSIGNPVPGKVVTIASSRGISDTITTMSGTTDASGQATFTVSSLYVGSSTYTATDTTDSPQVVVTQTATVTFVCVTGTALNIQSASDQFIRYSYINSTGITRRLSSLTITWPDSPTSRLLQTAHLEDILIWTGAGDNTSPITLSSTSTPAWDASGNRTINNGFSKTLKLTYNFAVSGAGSFIVVASWDNGAGGSVCTSPTVVGTP